MMTDGILLIDKPSGMTSFGVVARVRRVLSQQAGKKIKVGHTGTLDPFATGLLILCIGKETKNAMQYTKLDKVYEATIRLGQTSTTGDPEGDVTKVSDVQPSRDDIEKVLQRLIGDIMQKPPAFSALKINGQRAYHLARQGKDVDIPERQITIHDIELVEYAYPDVRIRTHVSSGTYIRSLAEDVGRELGVGAYCLQLRRTAIADWSIEKAQTLAELGITD
ncbi:tRNA pseudouridine(55) synthase TruB [Candidatus Saccharibacteria bacterium]|nr:tRNA pseudouridine(55) synthase TruB [Candidatus Saccharibacteria bacterium]